MLIQVPGLLVWTNKHAATLSLQVVGCRYINGMTLDDRPVRADYDWGFKEGRQFGRGRSGGQVSSFEGLSTCVEFTTANDV